MLYFSFHWKAKWDILKNWNKRYVKPCTHEQIKSPLFAQVLDPYEVNLWRFTQINDTLFANVYQAFR